jgi:SAM-dependent methyltransferase
VQPLQARLWCWEHQSCTDRGLAVTVEHRYVLGEVDPATEAGRLALLEQRFDTGTIRRLGTLGVTSGWRCLELGAGHGSLARWLSERVGPNGSVVAADIDTRFLTGLPGNVDVRELDIRDLELEPEFDLTHCRAVLMHLPDPADALARIVAALRPGGVLLAEEGDFGLLHFGGHPNSPAQNDALHQILGAMREARIMDGYLGRRLPEMLLAHRLDLEFAEIDAATARPGEPEFEWMRTTWLEATAKLVAAGIIDAATRATAQEFFSTSGTVVTSVSLVAAGARKPR